MGSPVTGHQFRFGSQHWTLKNIVTRWIADDNGKYINPVVAVVLADKLATLRTMPPVSTVTIRSGWRVNVESYLKVWQCALIQPCCVLFASRPTNPGWSKPIPLPEHDSHDSSIPKNYHFSSISHTVYRYRSDRCPSDWSLEPPSHWTRPIYSLCESNRSSHHSHWNIKINQHKAQILICDELLHVYSKSKTKRRMLL